MSIEKIKNLMSNKQLVLDVIAKNDGKEKVDYWHERDNCFLIVRTMSHFLSRASSKVLRMGNT